MTEPGLTFLQKLRYGVEAAGFFVLMAVFRVIGLEAAGRLGGFLGRNVFSLLPPDRTARQARLVLVLVPKDRREPWTFTAKMSAYVPKQRPTAVDMAAPPPAAPASTTP